jgi:hypothetical protein
MGICYKQGQLSMGRCISLEKPTLDFLLYLISNCIRQCDVDPEHTTVSEFIALINRAETPLGF